MAKSKKKVTSKAIPTPQRKPEVAKKPVAKPQKQQTRKPTPAPAKKQAVRKPVKAQQSKPAQKSKSKSKAAPKKPQAKTVSKPNKKVQQKKADNKKQQAKKGGAKKGKEVAKKKGAASKNNKQPEKYTGKKRGRKKKNKGSAGYQKIKAYILKRHSRRTNIGDDDKKATLVAKAIYKWLKINNKLQDGKQLTQRLILEALDELYPQPKRKLGRRTIPEIPDYLKEPKEFYNVEDVLGAMKDGLFRRVWIFSPQILGKRNNAYIYLSPTVTYTYDETFKDWVDWLNEMINDGVFAEGSPPEVWYRFKDPFYNTMSKRWEVKMIPCDNEGNCFQTGYIPQGVSQPEECDADGVEERFGLSEPEEPIEPTIEPEPPVIPPTVPQAPIQPPVAPAPPSGEAKEIVDEKVKTEKEKQKSIKLDNLIKIKQSIMEDLKFNKEMGLPIEPDSIKRLTDIRKQIDELGG